MLEFYPHLLNVIYRLSKRIRDRPEGVISLSIISFYKTAKACLLAKKFGNPLSHGYNSCQMEGRTLADCITSVVRKASYSLLKNTNPTLT